MDSGPETAQTLEQHPSRDDNPKIDELSHIQGHPPRYHRDQCHWHPKIHSRQTIEFEVRASDISSSQRYPSGVGFGGICCCTVWRQLNYACACSNVVIVAWQQTTPRGFEPLRAEPNGFLVHHLSHSVTVSMYQTILGWIGPVTPGLVPQSDLCAGPTRRHP